MHGFHLTEAGRAHSHTIATDVAKNERISAIQSQSHFDCPISGSMWTTWAEAKCPGRNEVRSSLMSTLGIIGWSRFIRNTEERLNRPSDNFRVKFANGRNMLARLPKEGLEPQVKTVLGINLL